MAGAKVAVKVQNKRVNVVLVLHSQLERRRERKIFFLARENVDFLRVAQKIKCSSVGKEKESLRTMSVQLSVTICFASTTSTSGSFAATFLMAFMSKPYTLSQTNMLA